MLDYTITKVGPNAEDFDWKLELGHAGVEKKENDT